MTCYVKLHQWEAFLKARYDVIVFFLKNRKTPEEIAYTLSMDAEQVSAIIKSNRDLCDRDFFYGRYEDV